RKRGASVTDAGGNVEKLVVRRDADAPAKARQRIGLQLFPVSLAINPAVVHAAPGAVEFDAIDPGPVLPVPADLTAAGETTRIDLERAVVTDLVIHTDNARIAVTGMHAGIATAPV